MRKPAVLLSVLALVASGLLLGAGVLNGGAVRSAGWPHDLADLEGKWVLDRVCGTFEVAPPEELVFSAGSSAGLVQVCDGQRTTEFAVQGGGRLVFAAAQHLEPLLPAGASEVYTMTHLCPPLPAWDHLTFFPDGQPIGPDSNRRLINYERE